MATTSHQSPHKRARLNLKLTLQFVDTRHQALLSRMILRRWVKIALSADGYRSTSIAREPKAECSARSDATYAIASASAESHAAAYAARTPAHAIALQAEITLRFVDVIEGQALNYNYRGKNYPTNVLTFPYTEDEPGNQLLQADLVLCPEVVEQEANAQNKTLLAHYAHLIIHGVLHAQGYTHDEEDEAQRMESLETLLLAELGFANPYQVES
jgi:probable rRNA maturation factor